MLPSILMLLDFAADEITIVVPEGTGVFSAAMEVFVAGAGEGEVFVAGAVASHVTGVNPD